MSEMSMTINQVPEQYKIYTIHLSDKSTYDINPQTNENIDKVQVGFIKLPNGDKINKAFIIKIAMNIEATKQNVRDHADEIKNSLATT